MQTRTPICEYALAAGELKLRQAVYPLVGSIPNNTDDDNIVAVEALGKIGGRNAMDGLIKVEHQMLFDEDAIAIRENYTEALMRIGEPEGVKTVVDYATMPEIIDICDSTRYLQYLELVNNPVSIPYLCELLHHHNLTVRYFSMRALIAMGCEKAIPGILEIIRNKDEGIWNYAYRAIERDYKVIKYPLAITSLSEGLYQPDPLVREVCLIGLSKAPSKLISADTKSVIRRMIKSERSQHLFYRAVQTYADVGGDTTRYYLDLLASGFIRFPNPEDREYRLQTISSLLGQLQFLPFLIEHLPDTKSQLNSLSQYYCFQVLPNKNILLSDGQELPAKQAVKWILMKEFYRNSNSNSN